MKPELREPDERPSAAEAIEATAAAWLAERDDGLTPERAAELARWRAQDARHAAALARLEGAWTALQQLREFRPEAQRHPDQDLLRARGGRGRPVPRRLTPWLAPLALAATIAVAASWWWPRATGDAEKLTQTYATTVDGYERVVLEDGSLIELNSDSEVGVLFTASERRVRLRRGEAHFTVAKNRARPFFAEAAGVAVRAVGTAFNVRLADHRVEVLVTEGRVEVNDRSTNPAQPPAVPELVANQRVVLRPSAPAAVPVAPVIEKMAPDAVREALAWQGPRLAFVDTPLADAVAQFNRRNPVQIEIADSALRSIPIGGSFRAENVDAFLRLLASDNEIVVERPDAAHVILRKAK